MTGTLTTPGFPEAEVRLRARLGASQIFPTGSYGSTAFGGDAATNTADRLDACRLVPPLFMPARLAKLIELGHEPGFADVDLTTEVGGFRSPLPVFISAFGSTRVAGEDLADAVSRQAGRLGVPMVVGENVAPVHGYGATGSGAGALIKRVRRYLDELTGDNGGVVVQQSTEDADAEVWNQLYSDPAVEPLLSSGRLAFEVKLGQGAKPGLGGMTMVDREVGARLADRYRMDSLDDGAAPMLRSSSPGTFTAEILTHQIRLMRNNFPRCRVWVKLFPGRDIARAVDVAHAAGAHAVTVDGAEGGTGWAPTAFLDQVGLPLSECLVRLAGSPACLLGSGRIWEGARAAKVLASGARAVGLGRAALLAADEDPESGLERLLAGLALELRMVTSAMGKYAVGELDAEDLWQPTSVQTF